MGRLTTHVLDLARGRPARGLKLTLSGADGVIMETITNDDGRCDEPLLEGAAFQAGRYEILFMAGEYLHAMGLNSKDNLFLDEVPIRFAIVDETAHYHVPLLLSPFGYSTYRGS